MNKLDKYYLKKYHNQIYRNKKGRNVEKWKKIKN